MFFFSNVNVMSFGYRKLRICNTISAYSYREKEGKVLKICPALFKYYFYIFL